MNKTKKKIILAAVEAFNEQGISNVRNQDIAKIAGISLSNFNYHFKTKQDLVYAVCDYMVEVLKEKVYGNKVFMKVDGQGLAITKSYLEYEQEFKFFYLDTYNILQSFPQLKGPFTSRLNESIQIIKNMNFLAIGKGAMKPEPEDMPGLYDHLTEQIWMNTHFWFTQMNLRKRKGNAILQAMESNFAILYPYLTESGLESHRAYLADLKKQLE